MKAIATVSMYDMGAANRNALNHSQTLEQRKQIIAAAAEQRYVEFAGGAIAVHRRHGARADCRHRPHPARVLRLLPHAARRVHARGRVAAS